MLAAIIVAGLCCSCTDQPPTSQATNLTTTTQQMTTNLTTTSATTTSATTVTNKKILSVQNILQNPELPTGCEVTSAAILLNYYGYNTDKVWLCDNFLPKSTDFHGSYGPDPNKVFVGNPKSSSGRGLYCHAPVIVVSRVQCKSGEHYRVISARPRVLYRTRYSCGRMGDH